MRTLYILLQLIDLVLKSDLIPLHCLNNCLQTSEHICQTLPCVHGCTPGWHGNDCNKPCNQSCIYSCNQDDGTCDEDVHSKLSKPIYYPLRKRSIDKCLDRDSNHANKCKCCVSKYRGDNCETLCDYCETVYHSESKDCISLCGSGYYGETCNQTCPQSCSTGVKGYPVCKEVAGFVKCSSGCPAGKYGNLCNRSCSEFCKNGTCNQATGYCEDCDEMYYGYTCDKHCDTNCVDEKCFRNGSCVYGCTYGFYRPKCEQACEQLCIKCNQSSGECVYTNETTSTEASGNPGPIIGGIIGGILVLVLCAVMIIVCLKRRSTKILRQRQMFTRGKDEPDTGITLEERQPLQTGDTSPAERKRSAQEETPPLSPENTSASPVLRKRTAPNLDRRDSHPLEGTVAVRVKEIERGTPQNVDRRDSHQLEGTVAVRVEEFERVSANEESLSVALITPSEEGQGNNTEPEVSANEESLSVALITPSEEGQGNNTEPEVSSNEEGPSASLITQPEEGQGNNTQPAVSSNEEGPSASHITKPEEGQGNNTQPAGSSNEEDPCASVISKPEEDQGNNTQAEVSSKVESPRTSFITPPMENQGHNAQPEDSSKVERLNATSITPLEEGLGKSSLPDGYVKILTSVIDGGDKDT